MPFKQKEILVKAEQKLSGKDVKKLSAEASRRSKPVQTSTHAATRACRTPSRTDYRVVSLGSLGSLGFHRVCWQAAGGTR